MSTGAAEILTRHFYRWEERGRGTHVFDFPVELEPVFYPFIRPKPFAYSGPNTDRQPGIFERIGQLFTGSSEKHIPPSPIEELPPVEAIYFESDERCVAYSLVLPRDANPRTVDMPQLLLMLSYCRFPVSFEIIGTHMAIWLQVTCREADALHVHTQVKAYYPTALISRSEEGLDILGDAMTSVVDFGLAEEFMRPIATDMRHDPYIGLFGLLEHLEKGERGIVQVLFQGAVNPWAESIMRSVIDGKGGSFFTDAPEMPRLAEEKVSAPLFCACVRVAGQADDPKRAMEIAEALSNALVYLTASGSNSLMALPEDGYSIDDRMNDMLLRNSHRLGMLLSANELATLVHFPTDAVISSKIARAYRKTKQAPDNTIGHSFVLGKNEHQGKERLVSVPEDLRLRHTHLIGATGTGKSTLLLSMIVQDIRQGNGLAVLDPHGDLIESILSYIPDRRLDDVIIIDPADSDFPVAFNILSAHSDIEKDILSSDLVAAFRRLSTSWGDQMNSVFANAILAFLESSQGGTLMDLRRFLVEKPFRDTYLKTVSDSHIVYYWQHEYPLLKSSSIGSILTRLDTFLRPKLIRNMVAQKTGLDFEHILDKKKILLVKLSQGLIGTENSYLLGTFFVSKIYQAAMARQAKAVRNNFFLFIDEFQNFITPSMSHILSGARKYHLGLILAHQDMTQLAKYDSELASSVVVNAGTRICFRLGDVDARRFSSGFSAFTAEDLENLETGQAIGRIEQPNYDFSLTTLPLPARSIHETQAAREAAIARSREKYGRTRIEVEEELKLTVPELPVQKETLHKQEETANAQPQPTIEESKPIETTTKTETEHRYLQMLIKRMGQSRGYKATLEELTPDGQGRVDVSLEREEQRIAVEVSVTTDKDWEAHNVEKCLAAGYAHVIVCSNNKKHLAGIQKRLKQTLEKDKLQKVFTFEPDAVIQFLDKQIVTQSNTEEVIRGYRVRTEYGVANQEELKKKKEQIIQTITDRGKK